MDRRKRLKKLNKLFAKIKLKRKRKKLKGINRSKCRGKYKTWRYKVFKRDEWTCKRCGSKKQLNAHHKRPWALFPLDRYNVDNGITLCRTCHEWVHYPANAKNPFLDLGKYS